MPSSIPHTALPSSEKIPYFGLGTCAWARMRGGVQPAAAKYFTFKIFGSLMGDAIFLASPSRRPAMKSLFRRHVAGLAFAFLTTGICPSFAGGIPTMAGVDHVGLTVPDLKQGIDFFSNVLGCEHVYTAGPFSDPKGEWMKSNLNVEARASTTLAMMRCGPSQNIELFQYTAKDQVKAPPKNSDIGGSHIAFYVQDLPKAVDYLKSVPGVTILGSPTPVAQQPNGGETFVYFLTPWGQSMELLTYPGGLEYEKTTSARLYGVHRH